MREGDKGRIKTQNPGIYSYILDEQENAARHTPQLAILDRIEFNEPNVMHVVVTTMLPLLASIEHVLDALHIFPYCLLWTDDQEGKLGMM